MTWPTMLPQAWRDEGFIFDLRTITADVLAHPARQPGTAVIFDMDGLDGTYSAAEFLKDKFDRVVLLTPRESIGRDEPLVRQQSIYRRVYAKDIDVVLLAEPSPNSRFEEGVLVYRNIMTGRESEIGDVALFTYSTPRVPDLELQAPLEAAGVKVYLVGDAYMPRNAMAATQEGHQVGNAI
ncbi:MAG: hypothetical protein EXQ85_09635 [Alphaproteobacteria bacterium]|nr:hypothetical protein [Alphaproteobacteria bacterium]